MKKIILTEEEKKSILKMHSFNKMINESVFFEADGKKYESWASGGKLYIKVNGGNQYVYLLEGPFGKDININDVIQDGNSLKLNITHPISGEKQIHNLGYDKLKNILNKIPSGEIEFESSDGTDLTLTKI